MALYSPVAPLEETPVKRKPNLPPLGTTPTPTIGVTGPGPETFQPPVGITPVPLPPPIMSQPGGRDDTATATVGPSAPIPMPPVAGVTPAPTYIPPQTTAGGPSTGPADISTFGPGNNLIPTQINPQASGRLQETQGAVDRALGALGTFSPTEGADTARLRGLTSQGVESLYTAPNRSDIALGTLKRFEDELGDARKLGTREIGQSAARLGRLGSGMVTTDLGNLEERLGIAREREQGRLAGEVAGQELGDRLNRLSATQGAGSELFGQDVTGSGAEFGRRLATVGATSGVEGQRFGQEASLRGELRGERGYQSDAEQQAINNAIQQYLLEQGGQAQDFGQEQSIAELLGGLGFGSSADVPLSVAGDLGAQGQNQAGALAQLLAQLGQRR